jgi:hypothetical protein
MLYDGFGEVPPPRQMPQVEIPELAAVDLHGSVDRGSGDPVGDREDARVALSPGVIQVPADLLTG